MRFVERGSWINNTVLSPGAAEFFTYEKLETRTIESLKDYLRRRIGGYAVAIKDMLVTNRLYRGRVCSERPRTIDDFSYRPSEKIQKYGRANRIGKPMFYCCVGSFPVLFEIHAKAGNNIALSERALSEPVWMHNLGYHPGAFEKMGAAIPVERLPLINPIPYKQNENHGCVVVCP
jgi:hypothetical protein